MARSEIPSALPLPAPPIASAGLWRVVDVLLPPELGIRLPDGVMKTRMLATCCGLMTLMALSLALVVARHDPDPHRVVPALLLGALAGVMPILLVRVTGRIRLGGSLLVCALLGLLFWLSGSSAGLLDASLWWLPLAPVLAAYLVGSSFSLATAGLILIHIVYLYVLHLQGHAFSQPGPQVRFFIALGCGTSAATLALFGWLYETSRKQALDQLQTALGEVQRVNVDMRMANMELSKARDAAEEDARRKGEFLAEMRRLSEQQGVALEDSGTAMGDIRTSTHDIAVNVASLVKAIQSSTSAMTDVESMDQAVNRSMKDMVHAVTEATSSLESVMGTMKGTESNVEGLKRVALDTLESMGESERVIGEIEERAQATADLAEQVIGDAEKGREAVTRSLHGTEAIRDTSAAAAELMRNLDSRMANIDRIVAVITEVAEQTNLLALNAAIIAAQAGDNGRGFSVVASEIKSLAGRTSESTKEIADLIAGIQTDTDAVIGAITKAERAVASGMEMSKQADSVLEQIVRSAQQSTTMVKAIAQSTQQQSHNTANVAREMERLARTVHQFAASTAQQAADARQIVDATTRMQRLVSSVQASVTAQEQSSQQVRQALVEIDRMAQQLNAAQQHQTRHAERVLKTMEQIQKAQEAQTRSVRDLATKR